jgi:hypothetical protein
MRTGWTWQEIIAVFETVIAENGEKLTFDCNCKWLLNDNKITCGKKTYFRNYFIYLPLFLFYYYFLTKVIQQCWFQGSI